MFSVVTISNFVIVNEFEIYSVSLIKILLEFQITSGIKRLTLKSLYF
jgi:hypothetical protein